MSNNAALLFISADNVVEETFPEGSWSDLIH